jgi:hypothetical protein
MQRADWTKLRLTATVSRSFNRALRDEQLRSMPSPPWLPPWVRVMMDPDDMPMSLGDHVTGTVIVAPGCRFREELTDEKGDTVTSECDGDRFWVVNPRLASAERIAGDRHGECGWRVHGFGSPEPPFRRLLGPSWLLTGLELRLDGAVTFAGREAWHVTAEVRQPGLFGSQRHDLTMDAELGILLRCESFVRALPLWLEQLEAVRTEPPETAEESRFAVPPDALKDARNSADPFLPRGLGTAAGVAAGALGFAIRHGPAGPPRPPAAGGEPMPRDADDTGHMRWPPVSDQTAYLLYRTGSATPDIAAELHEWISAEGFAEGLRRGGANSGRQA